MVYESHSPVSKLLTTYIPAEGEMMSTSTSSRYWPPWLPASSLNCPPAAPTLSVALAVTGIVPETRAPLAGEAIDTVGGVASTGTMPVPERVTGETAPAALTLSAPLASPPTPGAKTTNTSQCVPGAMTPFQLPLARQ